MTGRCHATLALLVLLAGTFPCKGACGTSASGRLSIEATLDSDHVAPGGTAILTVHIRSAGLSLPDVALPPLAGVIVAHAGTSQNFSMVNNQVERTSTTVYQLMPRGEGTVRIPPLRIRVGRDVAESSPLALTVSRAAASPTPSPMGSLPGPKTAPAGTPELFVQASVDRARVFWNQQIVLRLRLFSRVDLLGDVDWKPPGTTGFWTEGLGPPRKGRVKVRGVDYAVMEIPSALFPTKTGKLTIGPAQMRCRVARVIQPPDPWSMLATPEVVAQDFALTSEPVTVTVDPLPRGAPAGFQGAVGDFRLALHVDGVTVRAGEPITARATIHGTGNIATVRDPELRARGATRQYVVGSSTRLDRSGDRLTGERETDVAFVADQPGALTILPVSFVWFDPEGGRYRSQKSDSVRVSVLPGAAAEPGTGRLAPGAVAMAAPRREQGPFGSLSADPPVGTVVLLGISAVAYAAALAFGRARRKRLGDPRVARLEKLEALRRDLARAESLASRNEPAGAVVLAEHALLAGAGLRQDVDLAGLARPERSRVLQERGAGDAEISSLESLLDSLGAIAYAPPETRSSDARQAIHAVQETLERYRRELST